MLSLKVITLAYCIGILWGLYLEFSTLIITSIFLCVFGLIVIKNYNFEFIVISIVCILSTQYTNFKIRDFDEKYQDDVEVKLNITIISQMSEMEYTYKYNCKSENGDKFIVYFNKKDTSKFNIGDSLNIVGKFNLPDVARNRGRF